MNCRATPHWTTKIPPAPALFGRTIRTKLHHEVTPVKMGQVNEQIDKADHDVKIRRDAYANKRRVVKELNPKLEIRFLYDRRKLTT